MEKPKPKQKTAIELLARNITAVNRTLYFVDDMVNNCDHDIEAVDCKRVLESLRDGFVDQLIYQIEE